jgi:hypothetical protein
MSILFTNALPNPCADLGTRKVKQGTPKACISTKNSKETCKNVEAPLLEFWKLPQSLQ